MKGPVYVIDADEYDSRVTILRGTARILAAATGLLLVYGITFALEGMTTRVPTTATRELAMGALWTAPWLLLFCSELQDVVIVTGKRWVLWFGVIAALLFLYYFDHYTSLSLVTKAAMPPIAVGFGLIPHFIRRMGSLFLLSSLTAGVGGGFVLFNIATTLFFANIAFRDKGHRGATRDILFVHDYERGAHPFRPLRPSDAPFRHIVVETSH